jgi:hypothetical protein
MRPRLWYSLALLAGLQALGTSAARAETIPSPYTFIEGRQEAGIFVGQVDAASGRFGFGPKGGLTFGGRWGIELAGPVSLEGVGSVIDGTRDVVHPGRVEGDRVIGEAEVMLTSFDARFKFSFTGDRAWHGISPFIVAGGGMIFDLSGDAPADELLDAPDRFSFGNSFIGTTGLGTRWFVTDRVTLRVDGTFSLWKIDTPPGFSDPARGLENVEQGEWVRALGLTLSGLFRW